MKSGGAESLDKRNHNLLSDLRTGVDLLIVMQGIASAQ